MQMAIKIAELSNKKLPELQSLWGKLCDEEPLARNKEYYISRIAYRMQELEYGGLSTSTKQMLLKIDLRTKNSSASKLPPAGTRIIKKYKGQEYCIKIMNKGFEFNGMQYGSLSAIALIITGRKLSGFRFFGLDGEKNDE